MGADSKYPTIYWGDYSANVIAQYNLKRIGKEFHGACPNCGGKDRFWIAPKDNGELGAHCRQCGDFPAIMDAMRRDRVIPEASEREATYTRTDSLHDFKIEYSDYPSRKGVTPLGAKLDQDGILYIPMYNLQDGKLVRTGMQTIDKDGGKKFAAGSTTSEAFCVLGGEVKGTVYLAEGWATSASVAMSTGRPCVCAFSASNLPKVARILTEHKPDVKFVVAADNDDPGIKAARDTGLPYRAPRKAGADWNDVMLAEGQASVAKQLSKVRVKKELFVPIGSIDFKAPEWLVEGLLEKQTFAVCFGSPGAGKTFLALDMAMCVATGHDFHGKQVAQGPVFYLAGEGHSGFARRAAAWRDGKMDSFAGVPFFKSSRGIIITDEASVEEMRDTIDRMVDEYGEPALIVIDTLARAMGAADENSTKEMGGAIRVIDEIREDYDCTILAVHHTGHGNQERARGSSALLGAVDCEFRVEKVSVEGKPIELHVTWTKMKDAETPPVMAFTHDEVKLIGADLEESTSVRLREIDVINRKSGGAKLTDYEVIFMMAFDEVRAGRDAVDQEVCRDTFYSKLTDTSNDARRKVFSRASAGLVRKGLINVDNSIIYDKRDSGT